MTTALAAPPVPVFDVALAERSLPVGAVALGFKAPSAPRGKKSIPREDLVKLLDGAKTFGRSGGRMELAVVLAGLTGLRRAEIMWVRWATSIS